MAERDKKGRFLKGTTPNPKGRTPGSGLSARLRQAIADDADDIVMAMVAAAKSGDIAAATALLDRIVPKLKNEQQRITLPGVDADNVADRAKAVLSAVAAGEVSPDSGATVINSIAGLARITEISELIERIEALENRHESN